MNDATRVRKAIAGFDQGQITVAGDGTHSYWLDYEL